MTENNLLLTNTEMTLYRAYKYQNKESIQDRIKHIEEFNECCSNNSGNDECKQSKKFYEWSNDEYNDLLNESHGYFKGDGTHNIGLDKTVLIEEVYDSIAVGKIITNVNSCYKVIPKDVLEMEK